MNKKPAKSQPASRVDLQPLTELLYKVQVSSIETKTEAVNAADMANKAENAVASMKATVEAMLLSQQVLAKSIDDYKTANNKDMADLQKSFNDEVAKPYWFVDMFNKLIAAYWGLFGKIKSPKISDFTYVGAIIIWTFALLAIIYPLGRGFVERALSNSQEIVVKMLPPDQAGPPAPIREESSD